MDNSGHVTRAELTAHLRPIREDIWEIKADVKLMLARNILAPRGRQLFEKTVARLWLTLPIGGVLAAAVTALLR